MLMTKVKEVISEILKCNQYASRIIKINTKYLRFVSMPVSTDQQWFISIRIPPSGQRAFARWYHNWNFPGNSKIKLIQLNLLINKKSRKRKLGLSSSQSFCLALWKWQDFSRQIAYVPYELLSILYSVVTLIITVLKEPPRSHI